MDSCTDISERQKREQARVFRLAARDHGLSLKAISLDSGLPYNTVQTYASGQAVMSIASLFKLIGVVPNELLSLLLPDGQLIVAVPAGIDHDDMAAGCIEYAAAHAKARHPLSECGVEIGPNESAELTGKVVRLRA